MKVTLPKSWDTISIEQFPIIYDILKDESMDDIDKQIAVISTLSGLSINTVEHFPLATLVELCKQIHFIFSMEFPNPVEEFEFKGFKWVVNFDITKITAGEKIALMEYGKTEELVMMNLVKIISIFIKPYKKKWYSRKYVEVEMDESIKLSILNQLNIGIVYPLAVFFCKVERALLPDIENYLKQEEKKVLKKIEEMLK